MMNKIPSTWVATEISQVLAILDTGKLLQQGWSPRCHSEPAMADEEWGVLKTSAIQPGEFVSVQNKKLPDTLEVRPQIEVKIGDLLMTCAGPRNRCGVPCLVEKSPNKLMMSGKMYRFRGAKGVSSKYLLYQLLSRDTQVAIDAMKTGINDSGLNLTHSRFSLLPVQLAPEYEQKRIVAKIEELFSELDKGVEYLKKAQAQLKVYRQALLKHSFEGKLTADWREANKDKLESTSELLAHIKTEREADHSNKTDNWKVAVIDWEEKGKKGKRPSKPSKLTEFEKLSLEELKQAELLPDHWILERLGWMSYGVGYGTSAKSVRSGLMPVLRMGNIQNGKFDWTNLAYTSDQSEITKYQLSSGDVLFNRTNSPEWVGKTALYRGEKAALFAGYLIRINHIDTIIDSRYLNYYLNSHEAKKRGSLVKTDGVNQSNINGQKLSNYPFPYCSFQEQLIVANVLDEKLSLIDAATANIKKQLKKSDALRQSILKKAFSGELVEQDAHDEPASILLERIKAEKQSQGAPKKARKKAS